MSEYKSFVDVFRNVFSKNEFGTKTTINETRSMVNFGYLVLGSPAIAQTFIYFCINGAGTSWVIQDELNMPESTSYRAINRLRELGILVPAMKASKTRKSKGGPRPTIWAILGASSEEVSMALKLHYKNIEDRTEFKEYWR